VTFNEVVLEDALALLIDHRGKTPKKMGSDWSATGTQVISAKLVANGRLNLSRERRYVDDATYRKWMSEPLQRGDVILTSEAPLGEVAFIENDEPLCLGQRLFALRAKAEIIDSRYLYYFLGSPMGRSLLEARGTGTTVLGIRQSELLKVVLQVPALTVQRKIASILSACDQLIENNSRRIEILEEMAQAIYREWFVEFRYPGHEDVPLVDSELGPIPEGWEVRSLQDLVTTQYGYTESAAREPVGPKFLRGMDINKTSFIEWAEVPFCPIDEAGLQKFRLEKGDILVIRMADPGKVGMVERDIEAVFASYLVRLRPVNVDVTKPYFLFFSLLGDRYQGFVGGASSGTTRQSISAKAMTEFSIPLPTVEVQTAFEDVVIPIRELMSGLVEANRNLRETRDLLLPKLISGEIDVSGLDIELADSSV
jgi:type I restriction enzyme S subunit